MNKKIKGLKRVNGGLVSHEPDKMTCGWKYYFGDLKEDCEAKMDLSSSFVLYWSNSLRDTTQHTESKHVEMLRNRKHIILNIFVLDVLIKRIPQNRILLSWRIVNPHTTESHSAPSGHSVSVHGCALSRFTTNTHLIRLRVLKCTVLHKK